MIMKLKDLLKGRDKLCKYDELKEWRRSFSDMVDIATWSMLMSHARSKDVVALPLPDHIKKIIIGAIDAELKRMEEE